MKFYFDSEPVSDKEGRKWHCWNKGDDTSCYHFMPSTEVKKPEADAVCQEMAAHVVALETEDENLAVRDLILSNGDFSNSKNKIKIIL